MKFIVMHNNKKADGTFFLNQDGGLIQAIPKSVSRRELGFVYILKNLSANPDYKIEIDNDA